MSFASTASCLPADAGLAVDFRQETALPFLSSLPSASVDLVLTDPPYLISRETGFACVKNGEARLGVSMHFGAWDTEAEFSIGHLADAVAEMARVLRPGGTAIVFFDLWKLESLAQMLTAAGFGKLRMIDWIKTNPVPLNSKVAYLSNAREMAVCAVKGAGGTFDSAYDDGVYFEPICQDRGRFHPTQKPLALLRQLIAKHSRPGDLVVDPFSGSGATGVAALTEGRRFAGCEPDPKYYKRARDRIAAEGRTETAGLSAVHDRAVRNLRSYSERKIKALNGSAESGYQPEATDRSGDGLSGPADATTAAPDLAPTVRKPGDKRRVAAPEQVSIVKEGTPDRARAAAATRAPDEAPLRDGIGQARLLSSSGDGHARHDHDLRADPGVGRHHSARRRRAVPLSACRRRRERRAEVADLPRARHRDAQRQARRRTRLRHLCRQPHQRRT